MFKNFYVSFVAGFSVAFLMVFVLSCLEEEKKTSALELKLPEIIEINPADNELVHVLPPEQQAISVRLSDECPGYLLPELLTLYNRSAEFKVSFRENTPTTYDNRKYIAHPAKRLDSNKIYEVWVFGHVESTFQTL